MTCRAPQMTHVTLGAVVQQLHPRYQSDLSSLSPLKSAFFFVQTATVDSKPETPLGRRVCCRPS